MICELAEILFGLAWWSIIHNHHKGVFENASIQMCVWGVERENAWVVDPLLCRDQEGRKRLPIWIVGLICTKMAKSSLPCWETCSWKIVYTGDRNLEFYFHSLGFDCLKICKSFQDMTQLEIQMQQPAKRGFISLKQCSAHFLLAIYASEIASHFTHVLRCRCCFSLTRTQ